MKVLRAKINVGGWEFDFSTNIEIVSSWDTLTDTCKIEIPRNVVFKRDGKILDSMIGGDDSVFGRGDQVVVKLGYGTNLETVFMGRLSDVKPQRPMMLICEDEMYQFKQSFINQSINLKNTTLKALINKMLGDDNNEGFLPFGFLESDRIIADIEIGDISIKNESISKVLDWLRKKLGIVSYFRIAFDELGNPAPKFVSGLAYSTDDNFIINREVDEDGVTTFKDSGDSGNVNKTVNFEFAKNVINDSELEIKNPDDQNIIIIGKSKQSDNSLIRSEAGNLGGEVQTINYPELSQEQLDKFVQDRLTKSKYSGFSGAFTSFLEPKVSHGDVVNMVNKDTPEKNGKYLVKAVKTTFGVKGGKQFITLDNKLSDGSETT